MGQSRLQIRRVRNLNIYLKISDLIVVHPQLLLRDGDLRLSRFFPFRAAISGVSPGLYGDSRHL